VLRQTDALVSESNYIRTAGIALAVLNSLNN